MIHFVKSLLKKPLRQAYYQGQEALLGNHKRDLVVAQVDQVCGSLKESRDQFVDALDQFKTIARLPDSPLEQRYRHLKRRYELCRDKADEVSQRIQAISAVSEALFVEWEQELELYSNRALKTRSQQQLKKSRAQYSKLLKTLQAAESRMFPVLAAFQDQVLFLKHNLNAHAIAALRHEFVEMSVDISRLIEVMEKTLGEANQFVAVLVEQKKLPSSV